jgi:hypothetical protein
MFTSKQLAVIIAMGIALACSFVLTACGSGGGDNSSNNTPATNQLTSGEAQQEPGGNRSEFYPEIIPSGATTASGTNFRIESMEGNRLVWVDLPERDKDYIPDEFPGEWPPVGEFINCEFYHGESGSGSRFLYGWELAE